MNIAIRRLRSDAVLPQYQTAGSAAADVAACIEQPYVLAPGERTIVPLGFALAVPMGYEAQLRARSGLSTKHGITLTNGVGTIDADYRGEVGAALINHSDVPFTIEPGMRVAQMAIVPCEQAVWTEVDELDTTERGEGGYGSTGR